MAAERTEAIVLRGVDFSETSRIVTFLTPDRGRLACMARGVKRPKSQLAALLDTFNRLDVVYYWKGSRSVQQLGEASILDAYSAVKTDLEKVSFAAFPLELACHLAREDEPSAPLYATLRHGLDSLSTWTVDIRVHTAWQVIQLLTVAGHAPALDECVHCGTKVGQGARFDFAGGAACANCHGERLLSARELAGLRALAADWSTCPNLKEAGGLVKLLEDFATRQLEIRFRSTRVLYEMFG